ncbi:MAG TPA: hypothetical protein VLH75_20495 [Longimicrobiales bacterium]|nr:hypothetical protein [Longimicrobiales bacterium]
MAIEGERFGSVEVEVALDFERLERQKAQEMPRKMREAGAKSADAFVEGLESEYQRKMGAAREQLFAELISPKEFEKRAREAARAMNTALTDELKQRARAGKLGAAYEADFNILAGGFKNVETASGRAGVGIGRLNETLASTLRQAASVSPAFAQIINVLGSMALGTFVMTGVLAGLAALAWGWKTLTEGAREAKEAHKEALAALEALSKARAARADPALATRTQVSAGRAEMEAEMRDIKRLEEYRAQEEAEGFSLGVMYANWRIREHRKTYDRLAKQTSEGEAELRRIEEESQTSLVSMRAELSELAAAAAEEAAAEARRAREKAKQEAERQKREAEQALKRLEDAAARQRGLAGTAGRLGIGAAALPSTVVSKLQAIVKLEQEIAQLEADSALLGGKAPPETGAFIEAQRQRVQLLREELERSLPKLQEASDALTGLTQRVFTDTPFSKEGGGIGFVNQSLAELDGLLRNVTAAELELHQARRTMDPERAAAAEERWNAARASLRDSTAALASNLERAGLPAKRVKELLEAIDKILASAGINVTDFGTEMSKWDQYGTMATVLTRGLLSVADATGKISQEARRAVTGLLDVLDGLRQIQEAKKLSGFAQTLGFASGGVALLGGAAGILGALSAVASEGARAREELLDSIGRLIYALNELRNQVASDVTASEREGAIGLVETIIATGAGKVNSIQRQLLEKYAGWVDMDASALFDKEGRTSVQTLQLLLEALKKMNLGMFPEDLEGRLDALAFVTQQLGDGAGTAAQQLRRFLDVIAGAEGGKASKFAEEFRRIFDAEGATAAQAFLRGLVERLGANDQSLFGAGGIFSGLNAEEVKRLLEESNDLLGRLTSGAPGTTQDFVQARSITEITAGRMEGALYGIEALTSEANTQRARIIELLGATMSPSMVTGFTPGGVSARDFTPAAVVEGHGASVSIENNFDLHVSGVGDSTIAAAQLQTGIKNALGEVYSPEGIRKISRALASERRGKLSGQGRTT